MADPVIKQFVAEGRGDFPLEMLHVDRCWPARPADAAAMAVAHRWDGASVPARKVILATMAKYAPNRQRWTAAGWWVID